MRSFKNIAEVVHEGRSNAKISQATLSHKLGYKNGQFISNVERGLCSVPMAKIERLAKELNLFDAKGQIVRAMQDDYKHTLYTTTNSYSV